MSYAGSVSQTLNVQVAVPQYFIAVGMYNEATNDYVAGTIKVDGVSYSVTTFRDFLLDEGLHSFNITIPTGHEFVKWQVTLRGEVISESTSRPLSLNVVDHVWVLAVLRIQLFQTALTISAPSTVDPEASIPFTGKLRRPDTGAGIAGKVIVLEQPPGTGIASASTDANGNYSITVTAPISEGSYPYRTSFAGSAGLASSQSATMGIGVGEPSTLPILAMIAAIAYAFLRK